MALLPQCFQQKTEQLLGDIKSKQSGWSERLSTIVCEKKDLENLNKSKQYIETICEPILHDKLSKEEYDTRENALITLLSKMMATFPYGLKYDNDAMTIKIRGWKDAVDDMPYWALKKAANKKMKEGGKEPSAGDFRKEAWSYVSKYSTMRWIIKEQIKAISNENT